MKFRRQTLKQSVIFDGLGLHSGVPVSVAVHPSTSGIEFTCGTEKVQAHPKNVTDTNRSTRLGSIGMVEHMMSALAALEITDAVIDVSHPELPAMDGSALEYLRLLDMGGKEFIAEAELPELFTRIFTHDERHKIAIGKGKGHWKYVYDLGDRWPGIQSFETEDVIGEYPQQIAPARTIVLSEEIEIARQAGLGKGLNEDSLVIIGLSQYDNGERFRDEPARHKLLDLIGDLYLSGVPARMLNVVAERSGHTTNVHAAAMLSEALNL